LASACHLYLTKNGANFSVPGSGKTAVVLTVYEILRKQGIVNLLYVVGPVACFAPWRDEFVLTLKRIPDCRILAGGDVSQRNEIYFCNTENMGELYLTSFNTLANDID